MLQILHPSVAGLGAAGRRQRPRRVLRRDGLDYPGALPRHDLEVEGEDIVPRRLAELGAEEAPEGLGQREAPARTIPARRPHTGRRSGIGSALSLARLVDVSSTVACFDLIGITTCAKGISIWMQSGWVGFCHK